jgi:hypothetical protein
VRPVPASVSARWLEARCWNSAKRGHAERTSDHRVMERSPDATPALSRLTEFIAAADIGEIVSASPNQGVYRPFEAGQRRAEIPLDRPQGDVHDLWSSMIMNRAKQVAASVHQRRLPSCKTNPRRHLTSLAARAQLRRSYGRLLSAR